MATTIGAIVQRFDVHVLSQVPNSGGLWVGEVPESFGGTTINPPFVCLLHHGVQGIEYTTETAYLEEDRFDFLVFDNTLAGAEATALIIRQKFDLPDTTNAAAAFSITNATAVSCNRVVYAVDAVREQDSSAKRVYQVTIGYRLLTERTVGVS